MQCRECGSENKDSAKFCKKCGSPLTDDTVVLNNNNVGSNNNQTTKIIIVALIIVCVVLAGCLIYFYGFNHEQSDNVAVENNTSAEVESVETPQTNVEPQTSTNMATSMSILGGSFSTGSKLSDKTYASIYVGENHAGEKVKIQIKYSRDGNALNNGNMVSKTVGSDGYIDVKSAQAYSKYPDFAEINIYDTSGNLLATQSVSLSPSSGTQSF